MIDRMFTLTISGAPYGQKMDAVSERFSRFGPILEFNPPVTIVHENDRVLGSSVTVWSLRPSAKRITRRIFSGEEKMLIVEDTRVRFEVDRSLK